MRNKILGIWVCLLSITMMFGILFPFQGIVLGVTGLIAGCSLFFQKQSKETLGTFRNFLSKNNVKTLSENPFIRINRDTLPNQHPERCAIRLRRDASLYLNEDDSFGSKKHAKIFSSVNEAYDFIDFVPMGKQRTWSRQDVIVVDFAKESIS